MIATNTCDNVYTPDIFAFPTITFFEIDRRGRVVVAAACQLIVSNWLRSNLRCKKFPNFRSKVYKYILRGGGKFLCVNQRRLILDKNERERKKSASKHRRSPRRLHFPNTARRQPRKIGKNPLNAKFNFYRGIEKDNNHALGGK